jgi:hypothetical protein
MAVPRFARVPVIYDGDDNIRFAPGKSGANPLFIVGINPSTADDLKSDPTIRKVQEMAAAWGEFDGFVMLNLYPQRASKPRKLTSPFDIRLKELNVEQVAAQLAKFPGATVWAAWGDAFDKPNDCIDCLKEILNRTNHLGLRWKRCESLTTSENPRHPLSGRPNVMTVESQLTDFDIEEYLRRKERKKNK